MKDRDKLDIINAVLSRHGIEPLTPEEVHECRTKAEAQLQESLRRVWKKINEIETAGHDR